MKAHVITEAETWEQILQTSEYPSFLQSWTWGEFQSERGNKVTRLVIYEDDKVEGFAQYYTVTSGFFRFFYCPRGPFVRSKKVFEHILEELKKEAKASSIDFILLEPDESTSSFISDQTDLIKQSHSIQPLYTSIVDLRPDDETLLSTIRKTSRALIRKAVQNNIAINQYHDLKHFDRFVNLLIETTQRQHFNAHSIDYLKQQFTLFAEHKNASVYLAEVDGKAIAGAIILTYGKTATYLHAGSSREGRNMGAPQLLVWTAMQQAKEAVCSAFDLWGVAPNDDPTHPWAGITVFKNGFGGVLVSYPGSFVIPVHKLRYDLYSLIDFLKRLPICRAIQRSLLSAMKRG